ncbi:MAG: BirA family biotin operon repressor/biotin-[acetyl-CoA-carboxylase] ligase [Candidatus Midichloriaceae bacterium]|jgi:BirA family biotin operon repressor/biotin-[acetyl-CoA-carboxylase] ligase
MLHKNIIPINKRFLQNNLYGEDVTIDVFQELDSTNNYLKVHDSPSQYHACIAEQQTNGKGRTNNVWHSPYGQNIYLSISYYEDTLINTDGLSIAIGLSSLKAILNLEISNEFKIKWPNDLYFKDFKISGNLIEIIKKQNKFKIIIGIGININMDPIPQLQINKWTSLKKITNRDFDRNDICKTLISNVIKDINIFNSQGLGHFIPLFKQYDYLKNKKICISNNNDLIDGLYTGIDLNGHLLLKNKNDELLKFHSGDTSIYKK